MVRRFYPWQKKRVSNKFKINKYSILILLLLLPPLLQLLVIIIILIIMVIVTIIMVSKGFEKFEENGRWTLHGRNNSIFCTLIRRKGRYLRRNYCGLSYARPYEWTRTSRVFIVLWVCKSRLINYHDHWGNCFNSLRDAWSVLHITILSRRQVA